MHVAPRSEEIPLYKRGDSIIPFEWGPGILVIRYIPTLMAGHKAKEFDYKNSGSKYEKH